MISTSTFVFALVLVAFVFAALVWITYERHTRELESLRSTSDSFAKNCNARLALLAKQISDARREAPSTLAAEVADLREAVGKLRDTQRRFQGRFDAKMGRADEPTMPLYPNMPLDRSYAGVNQLDPELAAELALQSAPSAAPGAK